MAAPASSWRLLTRFEAPKIKPWIALRNTIGVVAPLAIATALGSVSTGLVLATGALNVCFSDGDDAYPERARRMLTATLLVAIAVFAGGLSGQHLMTAVLVAAVWAFGAGMMVALGQTPADIGTTSLVTLVVFAAQGLTPHKAVDSGLLALAGGLLETALALALWPVEPYQPQRQALASLYRELAVMAESRNSAEAAPPASSQSAEAQKALAGFASDHSLESKRYRSLLSQAERIRLRLLTLDRLRRRLERQASGDASAAVIGRLLQSFSSVLQSIGESLLKNVAYKPAPAPLGEMHAEIERLRADVEIRPRSFAAAILRDAQFQIDALAGQLRAVIDLAAGTAPEGHAEFEKSMARRPWTLRLGGAMATLYANLALHSAAFRHAVRLAVCVGLGEAAGRSLGLTRSYWLPMTIAIVLKPDYTATFTRGVMRVAGTYGGLVLATVLAHLFPNTMTLSVFWIAVFTFLVRGVGAANYAILVTGISGLVVFLVSMTGIPPMNVIVPRALNTTAGGAIALAAYALWPTWERTQTPESIARMVDALCRYFKTVVDACLLPNPPSAGSADRARNDARLARTNAEASVDRASSEPRTSEDQIDLFLAMIASSYRFAQAAMALEAGLADRSSSGAVPTPQFRALAEHVEATLQRIAGILRSSQKAPRDWPDLREDYQRLVTAGGSPSLRYSLIGTETDRAVNALNTLREKVSEWAARPRSMSRNAL